MIWIPVILLVLLTLCILGLIASISKIIAMVRESKSIRAEYEANIAKLKKAIELEDILLKKLGERREKLTALRSRYEVINEGNIDDYLVGLYQLQNNGEIISTRSKDKKKPIQPGTD